MTKNPSAAEVSENVYMRERAMNVIIMNNERKTISVSELISNATCCKYFKILSVFTHQFKSDKE